MFLNKKIIRVISASCVCILLQSGCTGIQSAPVKGEASAAVEELIKSSRSWDGSLLPDYPSAQPEITILRITIPPGARLHTHHHPVINAGVLLCGELTVVAADGKTLQLKAGDPIVELVNTPHYGMNPGNVSAEIVVFYAGTTSAPITVIEP